jgi:Ankyrin repeat.
MSLLESCKNGNLLLVKYYLQIHDIEDKDFYGNTSLALAVKNAHIAITELLIQKGANVNTINYVRQK